VLFIVLDDAGWNDFDWMGSDRNQFETPFMRKLAERGILLASHCKSN
jgi:arylsulfatase A-like enzyme